MSRFSEMRKTQALIDAGYIAGARGEACAAPTSDPANKSAWEQGWRARYEWYQGASISEVVRNLRRYGVSELFIRHTVINTASNICGDDYHTVLQAVMPELYELGEQNG